MSDNLNQTIGVLTRREVEARIMGPFVAALSARFDPETVRDTLRQTIIEVARDQGAALARDMGGNSLHDFARSLRYWSQDGALEIDVLELSDEAFEFDVTRCRYAELYRTLGMEELGATLSCNRDAALIQGFNPSVELTRAQTILGGAPTCTFRYRLTGRE
jgi:hypothetical protein